MIAEGELVMIHNLWKDTPEDRGQAVVDIFRLENGKIVEHWDVSQDIPENPANKNGMFWAQARPELPAFPASPACPMRPISSPSNCPVPTCC